MILYTMCRYMLFFVTQSESYKSQRSLLRLSAYKMRRERKVRHGCLSIRGRRHNIAPSRVSPEKARKTAVGTRTRLRRLAVYLFGIQAEQATKAQTEHRAEKRIPGESVRDDSRTKAAKFPQRLAQLHDHRGQESHVLSPRFIRWLKPNDHFSQHLPQTWCEGVPEVQLSPMCFMILMKSSSV